jgi:phenylacetaldehyde dehydrogenase
VKILNYIAGDWEKADGDAGADVCDASTGEILGQQQCSSGQQVERALNTANKVAPGWASIDAEKRAELLIACADALDARADEIAHIDARQTGVLLRSTLALSKLCGASFRVAAELLDASNVTIMEGKHGPVKVERLPLGPAVIIAPWNAPSGIACHKLASALAAGCPVLFKPSEWAQGSAQIIAECIATILPSGVFQLLHGDGRVGAAMVEDKRTAAVSFTGGLPGGQAVAIACARQMKPAQLELGGSNPLVVLDDADLDQAADGVVAAMTSLNGQWCRALGRLLVQEPVIDELLEKVKQRLAKLHIDSAMDPKSDMGPMVHEGHRKHLQERINALLAAGATIHQPSACPDGPGWFLAPTLITGLGIKETREELFGPVAFVLSFKTDREAVVLSNDTPFGLAAYVFGSLERSEAVASGIRSGMVKINGVTLLNLNAAAPRPAWGLSGLGDEGARETYEFFRGTRVSGSAGPAPQASMEPSE